MQPSTSASELNMFKVGCVCERRKGGDGGWNVSVWPDNISSEYCSDTARWKNQREGWKHLIFVHSLHHWTFKYPGLCAFQTQRRVRYTSRLLLIRDVQSERLNLIYSTVVPFVQIKMTTFKTCTLVVLSASLFIDFYDLMNCYVFCNIGNFKKSTWFTIESHQTLTSKDSDF